MKYPIGIQTLGEIRKGGYAYVDKTGYVHRLVSEGKVYFLSRPRRFGKSLLVSTLESYFRGERELFEGLDLGTMETEWRVHPVFHLDFSKDDFSTPGALEQAIESFLGEGEARCGLPPAPGMSYGLRFEAILSAAPGVFGSQGVVLVDEYDKPLLDVFGEGDLQATGRDGRRTTMEEHNRGLLRSLYSALKGADYALRFVFLTGVTQFSKVSVFSGLNHLDDISLSARFDGICGITQEELDSTFSESIATLASTLGESVDETRRILKKRYDGYSFSRRMRCVYNPFSLLSVFRNMELRDYWFKTATPTLLVRMLSKTDGNIGDIVGNFYSANQLEEYRATENFPLPLIFQSGYLTVKEYDDLTEAFRVDFPNDEVARGFVTLVADDYLRPRGVLSINWAQRAVRALSEGRLETFRDHLTAFLSSVPYSVRRHGNERERERYFQLTFYLLLRIAGTYTTLLEKESSHGRADCVVETGDFVYIFVFKLDRPAKEALKQIEVSGYALPYAADRRKVFKVGASFSSETGTIGEWLVETQNSQCS